MSRLGEQYPATDFQNQEAAEAAEQEFRDSVLVRDKSAEAFKTAYRARLGAPLPDIDPRVSTQQPAPSPIQSDIQARGTKALSEYEKQIIEAQRLRQQQAAEIAPLYGQAADIIDKPFPTPPGAPKPPPIPTREGSIDQTAAKSLFTVASVIGALGMMGGRGRGMLAMSGVTGMVEGFREGNAEKYKAAKEQYDAAVNEQLDQYRMQHQFYVDTMNQRNMSIRDKLLTIELRARATGDKIAAAEAGAGEWGKMADYVDHFGQMINNFQKQVDTQSLFGLRMQTAQLGLQSKELDIQKKELDLQKKQTEHPDDAKLGPAGKYYDKVADDFVPNIPTRGELREDPQRYTRLGEQQASALTFLKNAKMQVPKLKELANRVLSDKPLGSIATGLAGLTAEYRESGADMAQMMQIINTLRNEANRLETGGNRALQGMQQQVKEQLPTTHSNKTVAVRHLDTFDRMIDDRMKSILGKSYETEGGNDIRVREKSSGRTGRIPQNEFDPKLYDRIQ